MDFGWTTAQEQSYQAIVEQVRHDLVDAHATLEERYAAGTFAMEAWRRLAARGLLKIGLPEDLGGRAYDVMTVARTMEALGYASRDHGLNVAVNTQIWTIQHPIAVVGTRPQKERWLPALSSGSCIGAQAMSEENAGSDVFSLQTLATRVDGGYRLTGEKLFVTLGPLAGLFLVYATIRPEAGKWGVTCFVVERDRDGVEMGPAQEKMGMRTVPFGTLTLRDCFVPHDNLLGKPGGGVGVASVSLELERSCMLASQLGTMQRQLEKTIEHARRREQFGQRIGRFQSVSNRIAGMHMRLESARHHVYKVAWLKSRGKSAVMEAAVAKIAVSEGFAANSQDAMSIFGARGYLSGDIERDVRDALGGTIWGGTSDIQRQIVARMLGL